jgi:hypothetical protein
MKATKEPVPNPDLDFDEMQRRSDEIDFEALEKQSLLEEENSFDQTGMTICTCIRITIDVFI